MYLQTRGEELEEQLEAERAARHRVWWRHSHYFRFTLSSAFFHLTDLSLVYIQRAYFLKKK